MQTLKKNLFLSEFLEVLVLGVCDVMVGLVCQVLS